MLAHSLGGEWIEVGQAMVASIKRKDEILYLIKLLVNINESGPVLAQLSHQLGFGPTECILIHDDTSLPRGNVRTSMRGSDGGHKGIRSIIQEFQSVAIRRVKIGVGQPARQDQLASYVLAPFSPAELPEVETACAKAAEYALKMMGERLPRKVKQRFGHVKRHRQLVPPWSRRYARPGLCALTAPGYRMGRAARVLAVRKSCGRFRCGAEADRWPPG